MSERKPKKIWHYTYPSHLLRIYSDGFIKRSTLIESQGIPCVCFSSNPLWETAIAKAFEKYGQKYQARPDDMNFYHQTGGLVRIEVSPEVAPYDWNAFRRMSGAKAKDAKLLYDFALLCKARTSEWWMTFEPVFPDKWIAIEEWNGTEWGPLVSIATVRVSADQIRQGPIRHESLSPELLERVGKIYSLLGPYLNKTLEQFELGFMRDMHPDREIGIFEVIMEAFSAYHHHFLKGQLFSFDEEKAIAISLIMISTGITDVNQLPVPDEVGDRLINLFSHLWARSAWN